MSTPFRLITDEVGLITVDAPDMAEAERNLQLLKDLRNEHQKSLSAHQRTIYGIAREIRKLDAIIQ